MGCSPRFGQGEKITAPKVVVNRAEAKHFLHVVRML